MIILFKVNYYNYSLLIKPFIIRYFKKIFFVLEFQNYDIKLQYP